VGKLAVEGKGKKTQEEGTRRCSRLEVCEKLQREQTFSIIHPYDRFVKNAGIQEGALLTTSLQ
jgi:hypothetical protein